ncbi:MAG TPA: CvpA family protein [Paracoccaceae bacterium]|nr:CvpA family protein [Paracoccaceae bacterium]
MEGFTLVDGGVVALLFISAILAYARGFVREILSIAGWIGAAVVAFYFAPSVEPLMREIPVLNDIIGENCELGVLAGFAAVFAVALVVIALFTPLVSGAVQNSAIGSLDSGLGFLFGIVRGVLLIVVALVIYDFVIAGGEGFPMVDDSKTVEILSDLQTRMEENIPSELPSWIVGPYEELTGSCTASDA